MKYINRVLLILLILCSGWAGQTHTARGRSSMSASVTQVIKDHAQAITCLAFSPDGKILATGSEDTTVTLRDARTGRKISTLHGPKQRVEAIAFAPNSRTLAVGSSGDVLNNGILYLYETSTYSLRNRIVIPNGGDVNHMAFSPNGKLLATQGWKGVTLWDIATWRPVLLIREATGPIAFSPDGRTLVTAGNQYDGEDETDIVIWNVSSGKLEHRCEGHWAKITDIVFSPDGKTLAAASTDACVKLWETSTWSEKLQLNHLRPVRSLAFADNGAWLVSASDDGTIKIWNAHTWAKQATLDATVNAVDVSPDGGLLAGGDSAGKLRVWDMASVLRGPNVEARGAFSKRREAAIHVSRRQMARWRLAFVRDGNIWTANGDGSDQRLIIRNGDAPCWSPDKTRIAYARFGNIWLANADGNHIRQLTRHWGRQELAWSHRVRNQWISIAWAATDPFLVYSHAEEFHLAESVHKSADEADNNTFPVVSLFFAPLNPPSTESEDAIYDFRSSGTGFLFSDYAYPAFSPSGRQLAFSCNGDIWLATRGSRKDYLDASRAADFSAWEWDLTRLAAVASYDAPNYRGSRENYGVTHLSWSPDGKRLANGIQRLGGSGLQEIHVLSNLPKLYDWRIAAKDRTLASDGFYPAFSPNGRWIAYSTYSDIWKISVNGGVKKRLIEDAVQPAW